MIGSIITDKDGKPVDGNGKALSESKYQPSEEVLKLFARVQTDYQAAYNLQTKPLDEFDGLSLLSRAKLDQQTFSAYVGAEYVPAQKSWRWRGRKNTARNKLLGIAAHMLTGMLFPYVYANNPENEEDKMTARVMRILIEDHLKKSKYESKFLFMVLSALVNPAVVCQVEYVVAMQKIKQKMADGKMKILEAVDSLLTGIQMNIVPIDEFLIGDLYSGTGNVQRLPYIIRVRRIAYDEARAIYGENKNFKYVRAGATKIVMSGQDKQTLFDIDWSEADENYVQVITAYYRSEDLEVEWVGGVFMGNEKDPYNSNPFKHRRVTQVDGEYVTAPVYEYAVSGFEPLDPSGRFFYFKSGAFKEYWDDKGINRAHQLAYDGMQLDVLKPMFLSGVTNVNSAVIAPGATIGMPQNASATLYSMSPNITAALEILTQEKQDMSESTQDQTQGGIQQPNVTARAAIMAQQNARIFLGIFGVMVADLVKQIGELTIDCIIQHTTVGEVDATVPEAMQMKYKTLLIKGKEKGKEITNRVEFTSDTMGEVPQQSLEELEWQLFHQAGGEATDQRIYKVNAFRFARSQFSVSVDADEIVSYALGTKEQKDQAALAMFSNPVVMPFVDMKAVVRDFVIEKYGGSDPDRYEAKEQDPMLQAIMGGQGGQQTQAPPQQSPTQGLPALSNV